jgi:hypothetical protein
VTSPALHVRTPREGLGNAMRRPGLMDLGDRATTLKFIWMTNSAPTPCTLPCLAGEVTAISARPFGSLSRLPWVLQGGCFTALFCG